MSARGSSDPSPRVAETSTGTATRTRSSQRQATSPADACSTVRDLTVRRGPEARTRGTQPTHWSGCGHRRRRARRSTGHACAVAGGMARIRRGRAARAGAHPRRPAVTEQLPAFAVP